MDHWILVTHWEREQMPLVVMCGRPCSGKSTVATKIAQEIWSRKNSDIDVIAVDEETVHVERDGGYASTSAEKNTRGALKATANRSLSKKTVVILDSLNYIKGYRYELYCMAREHATRYCVVHVDTPGELCLRWNEERTKAHGEASSYSGSVIKDLIPRFERPDRRNRWDAPLFEISGDNLSDPEALAALAKAVANAVLGIEDSQSGTQKAAELTPTSATSNPMLSGTNVLHEMDKACQDVIRAIQEQQSIGAAGGPVVRFGDGQELRLPRQVAVAELRRHKMTFLKLATQNQFSRLESHTKTRGLFLDYLMQNVM